MAALLFLTGRYLLLGVPHEFITGEYKATFEGDYDFTLELVRSVSQWGSIPLWSDTYSGPIAVFASNFHVFEQAILFPFTNNLAVSIKILQVLQFLIAGLGMYFLSKHLFEDKAAAAFSATLYMFTPFYIGHLLSYLHYTGVYLLAPLVYLFTLKAIKERSYQSALALSLLMAYSLLSHPQNIFIGGLFYSFFYLMVLLHELYSSAVEGEFRIFFKKIIPITSVVIIATFMLSAFIVLPTLADNYPYLRTSWVKGAGELVKVDHGHIGSHSQSILAGLSLQHWPWFQAPIKGGEYPAWNYMSIYIVPFVMASVSLLIRFNWITLIFLIMTALSVQISLGINGRPDIFSLASKYIPFFGMSRTPYTYITSAILVFCLFSSITFTWIARRLENGISRFRLSENATQSYKWILLAVFTLPYLFAARYYGNNYNWTFISAKQPDYLPLVWNWLDENNKDRGRVIETCGIPTAMLLGSRMLPNEVDLLERYHRKEYLGDFLSLFGFKYVITPTLHSMRDKTFDVKGYNIPSVFDKKESMEEYYSALTTEYYYMYERLKDDPGFSLNTAQTKDVAIFENKKAFGNYEIYPARPLMVLGGTESYDLLNLDRFKNTPLKPAPIFIAQSENLSRLDELKKISDELVLHNTDALDLYMLIRQKDLIFLKPQPTGPKDWNLSLFSFGIQQPFPQQDHSIGNSLFGELTFQDFSITTKSKGAHIKNNFDTNMDGIQRVMLRSYGGPEASSLAVSVDGKARGVISQSQTPGFNWLTVWEGFLPKGAHNVEITVNDDKPVYFDSFAIGDVYDITAGEALIFDSFRNKAVTYITNYRKFSVSGNTASSSVTIGSDGRYLPSLRLGRFEDIKKSSAVKVQIDGRDIGEVSYSSLSQKTAQFNLPEIELSRGRHIVTLSNLPKGIYFDLFSLATPDNNANEAEHIKYERIGPSAYSFESGKTDFVVFNETNYPGWKMEIKGKEYKPVIANMFMNGFIIPEGEMKEGAKATIYYSNTIQKIGIWTSLAALSGIFLFLIIAPFHRKQ
ncbi:MAG: hypothetical protein HYS21_04110 [Deltaproteobacteria bacterium]|nr:hypothetical protein [Deltaproteobacteria bacterium]